MSIYEVSPEYKKLCHVGADMQDWSENYGKLHGLKDVTDDGLRMLNQMSQVGCMLTRLGTTFGTTEKSFTDEDKQLISKFMQNKVDIERK